MKKEKTQEKGTKLKKKGTKLQAQGGQLTPLPPPPCGRPCSIVHICTVSRYIEVYKTFRTYSILSYYY